MIAAIYARKSTEQHGADADAKSVQRQIENAGAFAASKGWTIASAHVYADDAISGAETSKLRDRQRLIDVITRGAPFQVLIMRDASRFSRRDGDEAFSELKALARAGVAVWFYQDGTRFEYGNFAANITGIVRAEMNAEFRRQIATWTREAMVRKAKAGHVTGGALFGYDNLRLDGHVERRINDAHAAVIRQIFELCAAGAGLKQIAKTLNAAGSPSPRAQRGRPGGWAPSSVREVLYRETYRGQVVWNKTRKRDIDGQCRPSDRPATDWIRIEAEGLRIVSDAAWQAAHAQLSGRRENYRQWNGTAARQALEARGGRLSYLLSGLARCAACGGSMQAVSRPGRFRYICSTYWNRGASICDNGRMVAMDTADQAIRVILATEVLRPAVIERALDLAIAELRSGSRERERADRRRELEKRGRALDGELANLVDVAARGGAVPAILDALSRKDTERRAVALEVATLQAQQPVATLALEPRTLRRQLRSYVDQWQALVAGNVAETRQLLHQVLRDRIACRPTTVKGAAAYELTVPIAFDRLLTTIVPGLQVGMASPAGIAPILSLDPNAVVLAA